MKSLPLIRHAKSSWKDPGGADFDQSFGETRKMDALTMRAGIIAVADVYDALASDRPYRKALPPFYAKNEIISNSGTHFDPQAVQAFETIFPTFDQESTVLLTRLHG